MAKYQVLYWYDIPIQVRAQEGRQRLNKPLSQRFQTAIDNAAMEAGLTGDEEYTSLFKWSEMKERNGSLEEVVAAIASELEAAFSQIDWHKTVKRLKHES